jgi:hypothetical protein
MQTMSGLTNPVAWIMFLVCILGVGFMVRFLAALIAEEKKSRARISFRLKTSPASGAPTFAAPSDAAPSALPVVSFSQRIANFGVDGKSARPVATLEISGKW